LWRTPCRTLALGSNCHRKVRFGSVWKRAVGGHGREGSGCFPRFPWPVGTVFAGTCSFRVLVLEKGGFGPWGALPVGRTAGGVGPAVSRAQQRGRGGPLLYGMGGDFFPEREAGAGTLRANRPGRPNTGGTGARALIACRRRIRSVISACFRRRRELAFFAPLVKKGGAHRHGPRRSLGFLKKQWSRPGARLGRGKATKRRGELGRGSGGSSALGRQRPRSTSVLETFVVGDELLGRLADRTWRRRVASFDGS